MTEQTPSIEIAKMLVLSTGHLRRGTAAMLDGPRDEWKVFAPTYFAKGEYGWFVNVSDEDHTTRAHMPGDLLSCMNLAQEQDADWIMFDRDGPRVDGIAFYEW